MKGVKSVLCLLGLVLAGCANMTPEQQQGTARGAAIGAIAGAVLGAATDGSSGAVRGAAIGAGKLKYSRA